MEQQLSFLPNTEQHTAPNLCQNPQAECEDPLFRPPNANIERIEAYLNHACAPLLSISMEAREEARAELRAHLEELIEAHEELGSSPEEAVEAAIRQFGASGKIARQWEHTTKRLAYRALGWYAIGLFIPTVVTAIMGQMAMDNHNWRLHDCVIIGSLIAPWVTSFGLGLHASKGQRGAALLLLVSFVGASCAEPIFNMATTHSFQQLIAYSKGVCGAQVSICLVIAIAGAFCRKLGSWLAYGDPLDHRQIAR